MSAYAVFIREKTRNPAEMQVYSDKVGVTLAGHPLKVLAAYGAQEVLEGPPAENRLSSVSKPTKAMMTPMMSILRSGEMFPSRGALG